MELGPVDPWQPPRTLAQTTKKRFVSTALPGPIRLFHQPGFGSEAECQPGAVVVPAERVADEDCVVPRGVQGAVGLVPQREALDASGRS